MRVILTLLLFSALTATAQEKTLHWKSLDVTAKIDRDGMMIVSERHRMVFSGDWNGGERTFRVGPGQIFQFLFISRIEPGSDQLIPLTEAADSVGLHQYRLDRYRLRWRARLEHDPPFRNRELTYVIDYALMNVIVKEDDVYRLNHDFAFADRPGIIESYSLNLELDPVWKLPEGYETRIEQSMIPPGESVIVDIPLTWSGEGQPAYLGVDPSVQAMQPAEDDAPRPPPPPAVAMPLRIAAAATRVPVSAKSA